MRKTKLLLVALMAMLGLSVNAAVSYEVDQKFTSVSALDGQAFAIVNEADGKAIYGSGNQNLAYDAITTAVTGSGNSGYYFKLEPSSVEGAYLLRLQTPAGEPYVIWGSPGYLNTGDPDGTHGGPSAFDGCFILGLNNQQGQDIENGAVWEIEYNADHGFALKNKALGGYFNGPGGNDPNRVGSAPTGTTPVYWTFCTLKEGEEIPDPVIPEPDAPLADGELIPDFFSICDNGGIPYGYEVKTGNEIRAYPNTYGSGARMFVFGSGGDFTKGLYFRDNYVQYGTIKELTLEAGTLYTVYFNSAMWKSSGDQMTFSIFKEDDLNNALLTQTIDNTPNLDGNRDDAVSGSTYSQIEFTPETTGNYILRWNVGSWNEVILANVGMRLGGAIFDISAYTTLKAHVLALDDDTSIFAEDVTVDISAAEDAIATATTEEGVNAACDLLRQAALSFVTSVTVNEGKYFDMTNIWIVNPTVRQNTNGWTIADVVGPWGSVGVVNYEETEFYNRTFNFYQTLTLPKGTYEFGVTGFHRAGNHSTYFYAGEDKILIPGVPDNVVNDMQGAARYFDAGNGKVALKFALEGESNTMNIGIVNNDTETDKWTIFRDFTLHYYGSVCDYSIYQEEWEQLVAEAGTAKTNNPYVTGTELEALNAAIVDAPDGSSKANYLEKIGALEAALNSFVNAAPAYNNYAAYKAETVALFGTDFNVAAPTSAAAATTAVQNLKLAQYNKVATDYPYSLTSKIGDFSTWDGTAQVGTPRAAGTPNSLDWEHWSGQTHPYYEQDGSGYNNNGGWTIQYTKTTELPAGNYVVKVAARSSLGVTSSISCTATTTTISLPCVGNRARGINTEGEASWSDNDTFILDNQGGGWEWRFLPFSLTEKTVVTMTFYAEASTQYQWMSIADGELLSAEDLATPVTYDEASENTIENVDIANVTITRNIKVGYNTVVLPFDLTLGQVEAAFGSGASVYAFSEDSEDASDATVNFTKVNAGTISANVPVLVKATVASTEQIFEGVEVIAPTDVRVEGTNFDFIGTYAPMTVAKGDYFIGNGSVYRSAGETSMNAFRAYIQAKSAGARIANFSIESNETTGISEMEDVRIKAEGSVYNLNGQRVSKAAKGLYIQNGKKFIVK